MILTGVKKEKKIKIYFLAAKLSGLIGIFAIPGLPSSAIVDSLRNYDLFPLLN